MLNLLYTPSSSGYVSRIFWTAQARSGTRTCFPNHPLHHLASCLYPMYRMHLKWFLCLKINERFSDIVVTYCRRICFLKWFLFFSYRETKMLYCYISILLNSYNHGRYNMLLLLHLKMSQFNQIVFIKLTSFMLYMFYLVK